MYDKATIGKGLSQFRNKGAEMIRTLGGTGKHKCKICGYRIRGKKANHESGMHHNSGGKVSK